MRSATRHGAGGLPVARTKRLLRESVLGCQGSSAGISQLFDAHSSSLCLLGWLPLWCTESAGWFLTSGRRIRDKGGQMIDGIKKILSFRLLAGPDAGCAWFVWSLAGSMLALVPLVVAAQRGRNPKRLFVRRSSVLRNSLLADAVGSTILA